MLNIPFLQRVGESPDLDTMIAKELKEELLVHTLDDRQAIVYDVSNRFGKMVVNFYDVGGEKYEFTIDRSKENIRGNPYLIRGPGQISSFTEQEFVDFLEAVNKHIDKIPLKYQPRQKGKLFRFPWFG